jgi:hypothetical protein
MEVWLRLFPDSRLRLFRRFVHLRALNRADNSAAWDGGTMRLANNITEGFQVICEACGKVCTTSETMVYMDKSFQAVHESAWIMQ